MSDQSSLIGHAAFDRNAPIAAISTPLARPRKQTQVPRLPAEIDVLVSNPSAGYVPHMFPDAKWLDALKLPVRLKLAVAAACGALLYLFKAGAVTVGPLDTLVSALLLIAIVVFAILVIFDGL